jgi:alkanesulfonate monooxygenase SsuD/methylene tetrahydromethanopterin reductase-like flavin-dependent oxidoreductase (luciferase family)
MENHGASFEHRWAIVREKVLAMKAIWTQDAAEFHGKHVDFDPIWSWPKPVQPGGPPIWLGANSKWVFDRVAEYCEGWMPIGGAGSGAMETMSAALEKRDRSIADLDVALFGAPADEEQANFRLEQGFTHLVFGLPQRSESEVLTHLDTIAKLAETLR